MKFRFQDVDQALSRYYCLLVIIYSEQIFLDIYSFCDRFLSYKVPLKCVLVYVYRCLYMCVYTVHIINKYTPSE